MNLCNEGCMYVCVYVCVCDSDRCRLFTDRSYCYHHRSRLPLSVRTTTTVTLCCVCCFHNVIDCKLFVPVYSEAAGCCHISPTLTCTCLYKVSMHRFIALSCGQHVCEPIPESVLNLHVLCRQLHG